MNKLFIHNLLDDLLNDKSCDFAQNLFLCLKTEATKCNDIKRLMAVVPVVLSLVHTQDTDLVRFTLLHYHKINIIFFLTWPYFIYLFKGVS